MKSLTSKTLPYRKCEFVYQKLMESGYKEINRIVLRKLVQKYCAASPKMIDEYERRFVKFEFLSRHPVKFNAYRVNPKEIFYPDKEQQEFLSSKIGRENQIPNNFEINKSDFFQSNTSLDKLKKQSKTVVYSVGGEKKVTCSFKGYNSIWQKFKEAVWTDGFPDICYVLHIFMSAFLSANREKSRRMEIPFTIRDMNFYITIKAPYIVQRPRRKITYRKEEIIEENE